MNATKNSKKTTGFITIIRFLLYNAKFIGLVISIPGLIIHVEKYTSADSFGSGEYVFWYSVVLVCSILLFIIDKTWKKFCDSILDIFNK